MPFDFKPEPEYDGTMSLQYTINGGDASAASPEARAAANRLVGTYQTNIYGFINNQRRLAKTSGFPQSSRYMNLPGLEVGHRRNGKHETVSINAKPGAAAVQQTVLDTNYDGYIGIAFSAVGSERPPTIMLNGVTIPVQCNGENAIVLIGFGPTAFLCRSLHDDSNDALGGSGNKKGLSPAPTIKGVDQQQGMTGPPSPGASWDSTPPNPIPKHDDAFGYFFAKWQDGYNPCNVGQALDNDPFWGNDPEWPSMPYFPWIDGVRVNQVAWYPSAQKSPLAYNGPNRLRWGHPGPGGDWDSSAFEFGVVWAEFYSRNAKDFRIASSSWTRQGVNASLSGVGSAAINYRVNDKPVAWMTRSWYLSDIEGYGDLTFDLTPKTDMKDYYSSTYFGFMREKVDKSISKDGKPSGQDSPKIFGSLGEYASNRGG